MIINASNRFQSDLSLYNVVVPSMRSVGGVSQSSSSKTITIRATAPGRYYAVIQKFRVLYYVSNSGRISISSLNNATISTLNYDKQNIAPENHTFSVSVPKYSSGSSSSLANYYYSYYIYITVWGPDKVTFIE